MLGACQRINLLRRGKTFCQITGIAEENCVHQCRYYRLGNSLFRPDLGWLRLRQIATTRSDYSPRTAELNLPNVRMGSPARKAPVPRAWQGAVAGRSRR